MDSYRQLCAGKVHTRAADRIVWSVASGPHPDESFLLMIFASSSQQHAQSVEGIAMSVVKFPGHPKRRPFAVAAYVEMLEIPVSTTTAAASIVIIQKK
jgi:hypothetical protein